MNDLRTALRRLAKAVVIITTRHDGVRYAMSATAVSEMSMDPPSMLVCVNRQASIYQPLARRAPFAINILDCSQGDVAERCSGKVKGEDRFVGSEWVDRSLQVPCLVGAQATIVCSNVRRLDHGTHGVYIGEVVEVETYGQPSPLVYLDGQYGRAAPFA